MGKSGVLYKTTPAFVTYPPTPGVLSLVLWNPCTKKIFFHREEAWCHVISVCHHMHGQCLMSHVCVYTMLSMSLCYLCLCLCYCICSWYIYPINLIDKDFNTLSILCNNKQRCFPYCFGDVISVNSLSKTQLEQAICLFFLLEHIPLIILNN
jgi:hypothetical protein